VNGWRGIRHVSGVVCGPANGGSGCAVAGQAGKQRGSVAGAEAELAVDGALALRFSGGHWAQGVVGRGDNSVQLFCEIWTSGVSQVSWAKTDWEEPDVESES